MVVSSGDGCGVEQPENQGSTPALTPLPVTLEEKKSRSKTPPKKTPPDFAYLEPAVAQQIGIHPNKLREVRRHLREGRDWQKKGVGFWWTKAALKTALLELGVPLGVVFPEEREVLKRTPPPEPGPWVAATVTAHRLTNHGAILAEVAGKRVTVQINAEWRDLFRTGMAIEVQKSPSGYWRTVRPARRGVFKL